MFDDTSRRPSISDVASSTWLEACSRVLRSGACTITSTALPPIASRPLVLPTVTSPTSVSFATSLRSLRSTEGVFELSSVVTTNDARLVLPPSPPKTLTWYDLTPSVLPSTNSTLRAASSVVARSVPTGSFRLTWVVSCPEESRKLVFRFGTSMIVPAKIRIPITTVTNLNRVANRSTGTYARCNGLRSSRCSARRWISACPSPFGGRRNQYASTGITVSETKSDASSATVTVTPKDENSCPTSPDTNAIGRNTATVVSVEDVTAPATSRTPLMTASRFGSPYPRWRLMFSSTTIESSTTRPTEMVSAPRVSRLSE